MRSKKEILKEWHNAGDHDIYCYVIELLADIRDAEVSQAKSLAKMESKYYENDIKPLKEQS